MPTVFLVDLPDTERDALTAALAAEGLATEALGADRVAARSVLLDPVVIVFSFEARRASGPAAIAGLKGNAETRRVPVLAVVADPDSERAAIAAGADGVLPAATDRMLLARAVRRLAGPPPSSHA